MIAFSFSSAVLIALPTREAGELGVPSLTLSAAALSVHLWLWRFLPPVPGTISCQLLPMCLTVISSSLSQKTKGQLSSEGKAAKEEWGAWQGNLMEMKPFSRVSFVDNVQLLYYCSSPLCNPNESFFVLLVTTIILEINS